MVDLSGIFFESEFTYDPATDTYTNTKWADKGVACEACHGPGSNHIHAEGADLAKTIVNPAKIFDPRRAAMVCGQCHTRGKSTVKLFDFQYPDYPVGYQPGGLAVVVLIGFGGGYVYVGSNKFCGYTCHRMLCGMNFCAPIVIRT
jgi:hypothetical protein